MAGNVSGVQKRIREKYSGQYLCIVLHIVRTWSLMTRVKFLLLEALAT